MKQRMTVHMGRPLTLTSTEEIAYRKAKALELAQAIGKPFTQYGVEIGSIVNAYVNSDNVVVYEIEATLPPDTLHQVTSTINSFSLRGQYA